LVRGGGCCATIHIALLLLLCLYALPFAFCWGCQGRRTFSFLRLMQAIDRRQCQGSSCKYSTHMREKTSGNESCIKEVDGSSDMSVLALVCANAGMEHVHTSTSTRIDMMSVTSIESSAGSS